MCHLGLTGPGRTVALDWSLRTMGISFIHPLSLSWSSLLLLLAPHLLWPVACG